jgi:multisubunit Na+/H+ antiporter MnhE subunit
MILFTSLASVSTYFVFGLIVADFAMAGFVIGFISSTLGQILMRRVRQAKSASGRKFERNSYLAFVIGGVVLVSALLMTIQYVFMIVDQPDEDTFGGLCDGLRF